MNLLAMTGEEALSAPLRLRSFVFGMVSLLVVLVGGWNLLRAHSSPHVEQLQIEGPLLRVSSAEVRAALQPLLEQEFLALDLNQAREHLSAIPWVARSRIERIWPGTLRVVIWEREPFARWNAEEVLDHEAQAFKPAPHEIPPGLVQLGGVPGREREVMAGYQQLAAKLASTPFALSSLRQDARGEWTARTVGGIELRLGQDAAEEKVPVLLGSVLNKLSDDLLQVEYIDLRYTNGFAVGWRTEPASSGSEKHG